MEEFLQAEYIKFVQKKGRLTSAAEFGKWLGVSNTSLSQWMNGIRDPSGDNVYKLADKLGPRVYDILELPRMFPQDSKAKRLVDIYYSLSDADRNELVNYAKNLGEDGAEEVAVTA